VIDTRGARIDAIPLTLGPETLSYTQEIGGENSWIIIIVILGTLLMASLVGHAVQFLVYRRQIKQQHGVISFFITKHHIFIRLQTIYFNTFKKRKFLIVIAYFNLSTTIIINNFCFKIYYFRFCLFFYLFLNIYYLMLLYYVGVLLN